MSGPFKALWWILFLSFDCAGSSLWDAGFSSCGAQQHVGS